MTADNMELVREYALRHSEAAFATLVERHINLVYSVAMRRVADTHLAEEITQAVFIILARKANALGAKTILPGWLCRTAHYVSSNALTMRRRRRQHEQEASMQSVLNEPESAHWNQIAPLLEDALARLNKKDYDAIVLRFFENRSFGEVGLALGIQEDTARMRIARALEKLRKYYFKRGMDSTTAAIAGAISANSVQMAPATLAKAVSATAVAKGAAASASTATLIKGALKLMAWSKAKTVVVIGACAIVLASGTLYYSSFSDTDAKPTFYSILEHPPTTFAATWTQQFNAKIFPPNQAAIAKKRTYTLVVDGDNYRFEIGGMTNGKFGYTLWSNAGKQLTKFNLKWNNPDGESGNIAGFDKFVIQSISSLTTFGITRAPVKHFNRDWNFRPSSFKGYGGDTYSLRFVEKNGLPLRVTIHDEDNSDRSDETVTYHYDPQFFDGRLPAGFTVYLGDTANDNTMESVWRIQSLKIYSQHLPSTEFDPDKLVNTTDPNYKPLFYSNNVAYWTDDQGHARRVLTAAQNAAH